jgi:hypothetical protein
MPSRVMAALQPFTGTGGYVFSMNRGETQAMFDYLGRHWIKGELYDGPVETFPANVPGWAQREPLPSEEDRSGEDLSFTPAGRTRVNWHHGPPALPQPAPVMTYDALMGEQVDEEATRNLRAQVDTINQRMLPKLDRQTEFRRHLEYLKIYAPECVGPNPAAETRGSGRAGRGWGFTGERGFRGGAFSHIDGPEGGAALRPRRPTCRLCRA